MTRPYATDEFRSHRSGEAFSGIKYDVVAATQDDEGNLTFSREIAVVAATFTVTDAANDVLLSWTIGDGLSYEDNDDPDDDFPTTKRLSVDGPSGALVLAQGRHTYWLSITDDAGETRTYATGDFPVLPAIPT